MSTHITIDGKIKHRYNSEGELIHSTEDGIRNFYKWFGESTATDNQGRPKVFYHGTDAKFDTFKPQPAKTSTIFGVENVERQGHFFTPSLDFAKEYTKSGNVMKVYLKMHKPFDMRNGITSDMYDTMDKHGINPKWLISNHIDDWERFDGEDGKHFKEALHNSGHDSAIIFEPHGKEAREAHIVFHPNQIKSATGNEGNFDMSKESINESVKDQIQQKLNDAGFEIHDYISGTARKIGSDGSRTLQISKVLGKAKVDSNTINSYNTDRQSRGLPHTPTNFNKVELPSHIDVDGVKRPTTNNKGEQIHQTEEGVRNFWKWFGDSNTVDNQGRPVIHYHGTQSQSEIDSFRSPSSAAHWASPSPELASKYGRGNSVYPIYVKSHTPFNTRKFSDGDYADIGRFKDNLSKQAPISDKDTISHLSNMVDHGDNLGLTHKSWSSSEGIESYKKLGFDSIHHTEDGAHTVGVFHPNQIKSAIGNTGNFSTQSHSINESLEHPMIDVDGELKHRHNSNGQPIHHTDEGIKNFHRWFGDSRVIDEHGRPLVVYHGTTHGKFQVFNTNNTDGDTDDFNSSIGAHFTESKAIADRFAKGIYGKGKTPHLHEVYLKIETPLTQHGKKIITPEHVRIDTERFNSENKAYNAKHDEYQNNNKMSLDDMAKLIDDHGIDYALEYQNKMNDLPKPMPPKPPISRNPISEYELVEKSGISYDNMVNFSPKKRKEYGTKVKNNLISDGHDGVLYRNAVEKEGWGIPTWIAFHPNQIKSATDNEGNFDMSKESINESVEHPMIDVDGEMKHRHNSEDNPIHHTDEGIKNFHRWFGNSKVVDKHGRPLVVYHGTRTSFDSFEHGKGKFTDTGVSGKGFYFTPKADYADAYGRNEHGANIMPVYLKLENPFIHKGSKTEELFTKFAGKRPNDYWNTDWSEKVTKGLKSIGHDGYMDSDYDLKNNGIEFVAFHPSQIKSTIGNSGTFAHPTRITEDAEHPMIDVDGEMKHRHNSNGQPIHHTDEGIRNFHKWFDKSKAVDEHGRPQVFYHGTTHNFKSFDPSKSGQKDHGWYGVGHYFTPDVYTASAYSTYDAHNTTGANVMPVYLKLHNPYKWTKDIPIKKTSEESMEATMNMRNNGNDGVFVENEYATPGHEKFYEAVVFHPHQIKSATGNQGNFDISKDSINESVEFPEEAIVGRLKEMRDSGRYKVTHKEYNSKYDQHEFQVNALPSTNAVFYHHQKGRPDQSWYNPDMAELHTPYPEDQFSRTYPKLKTNIGYTPSINEQRTPGVLYRGMSHEEFKNIKSTGQIKSHGDYNLEGQEGLTYYSRDPDQAAHYAHGFAPAQFKASGKHNVYVVAVRDPNTDVKIAGTGEDEVGIPHAISTDDILHVHVGKAYASHPGSHTMTKDWGGNYSDGSSFQPSTYVGWKKMRFEEL